MKVVIFSKSSRWTGWSRARKVVLLLGLATLPLYLGQIMSVIGAVVPLNFFQAGERYMFRVLDQAGIYILLALGLNIVVGYAGLLDLGYVAFYAIGAYSYALLASPQLGLHVPFWLVLPVAPLLAIPPRRRSPPMTMWSPRRRAPTAPMYPIPIPSRLTMSSMTSPRPAPRHRALSSRSVTQP